MFVNLSSVFFLIASSRSPLFNSSFLQPEKPENPTLSVLCGIAIGRLAYLGAYYFTKRKEGSMYFGWCMGSLTTSIVSSFPRLRAECSTNTLSSGPRISPWMELAAEWGWLHSWNTLCLMSGGYGIHSLTEEVFKRFLLFL